MKKQGKRTKKKHLIWKWTYAQYNSPHNTPGAFRFFLGDHKFKCLGKLSNGWTDWHQIWYKSADSSGNEHRLDTIRPSIHQEVIGGGGHKFKSLGKLSNNLTDWHQMWYTSADSSGNGHRLNAIRPSIPQEAFRGDLGGHKFKSGKAAKRIDRLAPNSVHVCGFIWEWT